MRNTLLLVGAAFIWGTAFVAQSVGSGYVGPYTFLAKPQLAGLRFSAGAYGGAAKNGQNQQRGAGLLAEQAGAD